MAKRDHIAFSIAANGSHRLLFWVEERTETDDLTIKVRFPRIIRLIEQPGDQITAHNVVEAHYSVHTTDKSDPPINVISSTMLLAGGKKIKYGNYSRAIKQTGSYVHVFGTRCTDLRHHSFDSDKHYERRVTLGEYDPSKFQLIYQVLASSKTAPRLRPEPQCQSKEIDFRSFRLTIIWTFLSWPSLNTGQVFNFFTLKPEELPSLDKEGRELFQMVADGIPYQYASPMFVGLAHFFKEDLVAKELATAPATVVKFFRIFAAFFNTGTEKARYRRHLRKCGMAIARDPELSDIDNQIKLAQATS